MIDRIEQLEKTVRRQRYFSILLVLVVGGLGLMATDKEIGSEVFDQLRVKRLTITTDDGSPTIVMTGSTGRGMIGFPIPFDSTELYAAVGASKDGGVLLLNKADGSSAVTAYVSDYKGTILLQDILDNIVWMAPEE